MESHAPISAHPFTNPVRTRLSAGGKRIRTLGPTLTKVSAGVLPKGDPRTTGWGPVLSSGPLARWRLAARPLSGPYTARPRFRISFAPAESPNFRYRSLGTTPEFETTFLPQPEYNCATNSQPGW